MVFTDRLKNIDSTRVAFVALAATILLLPLGLGGARVLPFALAQIGLAIFFTAYAAGSPDAVPLPRRLKVAGSLFALVLLWGWVQTVGFTPSDWHHPLWSDANTLLGGEYWGAISLTPQNGHAVLMTMTTYALLLAAVYVLARDPITAHKLLMMLWCVGVAVCLYGLVLQAADSRTILWWDKWGYETDLTATFVNRNHFADYAGIVFIVGLGLAWQSLRTLLRTAKPHARGAAIQSWLLRSGLAYTVALLLVMMAIIFSHSRAGLVATLLGTGVFGAAYLVYQKRFMLALALPLLVALAGAGAVATLGDSVSRFNTLFSDYSSRDRMTAYTDTANAIADNPFFGHGLGSFEQAFRLYRSHDIRAYFDHAHSDWLEMAFDLGVPAAALLFIAIALLVSGCWHGVRTRRQYGLYPALGLGVSALVLAHALVDFNLQVPGVVVSWLLVLGAGLAQGWSSRHERH
jgi:O-antigen ligase